MHVSASLLTSVGGDLTDVRRCDPVGACQCDPVDARRYELRRALHDLRVRLSFTRDCECRRLSSSQRLSCDLHGPATRWLRYSSLPACCRVVLVSTMDAPFHRGFCVA